MKEKAEFNETIDYVNRLPHESVEYEYVENSKSNNPLVNALASNHPYPRYMGTNLVCQLWQSVEESVYRRKPEYALHHQ